MVEIRYPPPAKGHYNPIFYTLDEDKELIRIFDPCSIYYLGNPISFRHQGPFKRFDHQRGKNNDPNIPDNDSQRGIFYAALDFSSCIVEIFGDSPRIINCGTAEVAKIKLTRQLKLLELRNTGAMKAGTSAAIAKIPDYSYSQSWARFFYDNSPDIDGIVYYNAHNDESSFALNERSCSGLSLVGTVRLDDPGLRPTLLQIAQDNGLTLIP